MTTQVLLLPRPSDDPFWAGQLHIPGTYIRVTDTEFSLASAFERLRKDELNSITFPQSPVFIQTLFHQVQRGMELALVYSVDLTEVTWNNNSDWFDINNLPQNLVETQISCIRSAAKQFSNTA